MATVDDVEVANASFPNVRQDLNDILEAITTNFSADTEPTTTYPNQFWYETDTNLLYIRNEADDAWITLASINQTTGEWEPRTAVIQAIDAAGLSFKTDEGTTRVEIADDGSVTVNTSLDVDNIKIDGNTISSTDTNGDINITPDGTGKVVIDGLNYPTTDGSDGQVLTTDGSGNIAFEDASGGLNTPNFFANRSTDQGGIASATETVIVFDATDFDTDSGFNTSTGKYTVPTGKGGKYFLSGGIRTNGSSSATRLVSYIYVNNVQKAEFNNNQISNGESSTFVTAVLNLSAGDVVDIRIFQNQGSPISAVASGNKTYFNGFRLSE